jgi:hypothetical protein
MEGFSLRAEYCCCCVSSDGQGSPGGCTEAPARLSGSLKPGRRGSGGLRRLRPPVAGRWRRSRASLHLARRQRQQQAPEARNRRRRCHHPAEWRRSRRRPERCRCRANVSPTSPPILVWRTILVVSRWRCLFIIIFFFFFLPLFFNLFVGTSQGRAKANLLWLRLPRRPRRLPQRRRRRAGFLAPEARCRPSQLSWMRRALRPAG